MNKTMRFTAVALMAGAASVAMASAPAQADALHGFCWGATPTCIDNGTNTPTGSIMPNFGFTASSGPEFGDFRIDILVPNNISGANGLSFGVTGSQGGLFNNLALSGTASLFSASAWTSGNLASFLGLGSASPTNPIGAFLPSTQALDPGALGYFIYQLDLGLNTLQSNPQASSGPLLSLGNVLPEASYIVGFLDTGFLAPSWTATANSGAILETGTPPRAVPEPSSLITMGAGLLLLGYMARRRFVKDAA